MNEEVVEPHPIQSTVCFADLVVRSQTGTPSTSSKFGGDGRNHNFPSIVYLYGWTSWIDTMKSICLPLIN